MFRVANNQGSPPISMNKVAHYLQEHLIGEVVTSADARKYFANDASVFTVAPAVIVYPRNESDVRKTCRFTWQLAERGRIIPVTARGAGTDQGGAAIGAGVLLAFPAHMNRILELDGKSGNVIVEPGINYAKLQQTLQTHTRFLPPYPASMEYSTIGGAIANNASGEKSIKYGSTREFVKSLRVVLANGEVIETRRLSKRELNKKLGLATFEGEIYRTLDALIEENMRLLREPTLQVTKNTAGYALAEVKRKDGSFDLTPLFVGSQGTLGIVTEATLTTEPYTPTATVVAALLDDIKLAEQVIADIRKLLPSALEMVDGHLLQFVHDHNQNQLKDILRPPFPKMVLLIEFDNASERMQKRLSKKALKILDKYQVPYQVETELQKREELWKVRHAAGSVLAHSVGTGRALPIIDDGVVPQDKFSEFIQGVYDLFAKHNLQVAVWGHAGDANIHVSPFLDLSQVGDRQKAFRLIDEYYELVISLGGTTSGQYNDGRLRAPYLAKLYGQERYDLFAKVKQAFDPYGTLNPGVKIQVNLEDIKPLVRSEYSLHHLYQHMPRS